MFLAHLPVGYLASRLAKPRAAALALMIGSVFPDIDMLWFWLVDHGAHHHHTYWTHTPWFWALTGALVVVGLVTFGKRGMAKIAAAFVLGVFLHLVLDTLVGDVRWLAPFDDRFISLFTVDAVPGRWWVWNFVFHWSFGLELALTAASVTLGIRNLRRRGTILGQ